MFHVFDKIVFSMAAVRLISAIIEFTAAMLMLYFGKIETAFKINSLLALVGPAILIIVTSLGLVGLAGKVSSQGMLLILIGITLIFWGINKI
ncbi:MAG: YqhV family protein [Clostridiales bacterium]|nr:YqhV family protein [Clostridiales bacterium]MCF8022756.1 YqhV family protein [Clostridiales bacterium]